MRSAASLPPSRGHPRDRGLDLFEPEPPSTDLPMRWRDLVDRILPRVALDRPDWPVHLNHCFARILLDNACDGPWREHVAPPAWVNMPPARLAVAIELGEAVLAGRADLALLNRRSLRWRDKDRAPAAPKSPEADRLRLGRFSGTRP